jgi:hypothetical protein
MLDRIPENHPLRQVFRRALDLAFSEQRDLYSPDVASHLSDDVLCDFIHVDRIYRLKDAEGRRLEDLHEMLNVSGEKEGPERRLEVDRYIGDFTLFMVGFFPGSVSRNRWFAPQPMVSKVGNILVSFQDPVSYYTAEGRNAYGRAAETARLFDPTARGTYKQLAAHFEGYLDLLLQVRRHLADLPQLRQAEGILD